MNSLCSFMENSSARTIKEAFSIFFPIEKNLGNSSFLDIVNEKFDDSFRALFEYILKDNTCRRLAKKAIEEKRYSIEEIRKISLLSHKIAFELDNCYDSCIATIFEALMRIEDLNIDELIDISSKEIEHSKIISRHEFITLFKNRVQGRINAINTFLEIEEGAIFHFLKLINIWSKYNKNHSVDLAIEAIIEYTLISIEEIKERIVFPSIFGFFYEDNKNSISNGRIIDLLASQRIPATKESYITLLDSMSLPGFYKEKKYRYSTHTLKERSIDLYLNYIAIAETAVGLNTKWIFDLIGE